MKEQATCRDCGALVVWATSAKSGKRAPIDARHTDTGRFRLYRTPDGELMFEHAATLLYDEPLHTIHFATCPDRRKHAEAAR